MHRLSHKDPQLRKILNIIQYGLFILAVKPRNETSIVSPGHIHLKTVCKTDRPRRSHGPRDAPFCRMLYTCNQSGQRRFSRTVSPANSQTISTLDSEIEIAQHFMIQIASFVGLENILELNHISVHFTLSC